MIRRLNLISKFMASSTGKQIIAIKILSNISRSKDNQTIKFGHLIEIYFLKSHTQNMVENLVQDCFLKNQHISGLAV